MGCDTVQMRRALSSLRALAALMLCLALPLRLTGCGAGGEAGPSSDGPTIEAAPGRDVGADAGGGLDLASVPEFSGAPYVEVDGGVPNLPGLPLEGSPESYSDLDALGRCGVAMAIVSPGTMPAEERGSIGMVRPSGWHTVRYDDLVDGKYLYNRCHLIGYQLTAENANERNLITGTRYMNVEGMLPFEDEVADYVERTGNRVLYRVTPIFVGEELVARGVQMEARSIEDDGAGVSFNVFCYNVQPGIEIDYETGESRRAQSGAARDDSPTARPPADQVSYVLNVGTGKFHLPGCPSVSKMAERNRRDVTSTCEEMVADGYSPCANCIG